MKIIILILVGVLFIGCLQTTNDKQKTLSTKTNDTLKLIEILSFNNPLNTSIFISNDSVLFVIPDNINKPSYCTLRVLFYDSANRKFEFKNISDLNLYNQTIDSLKKFNKFSISIKSIANIKTPYVLLPDSLKNKNIIKNDTKIFLYNNNYYFIKKINPQILSIYNSQKKEVTEYNIAQNFFEITDFFLYDIDKDGNAEIFIFNKGKIPRDDVISYSIYSIRKDSINMLYE